MKHIIQILPIVSLLVASTVSADPTTWSEEYSGNGVSHRSDTACEVAKYKATLKSEDACEGGERIKVKFEQNTIHPNNDSDGNMRCNHRIVIVCGRK